MYHIAYCTFFSFVEIAVAVQRVVRLGIEVIFLRSFFGGRAGARLLVDPEFCEISDLLDQCTSVFGLWLDISYACF